MFSPKLYVVRKLPLVYIINNSFNCKIGNKEDERFCIKQQDNSLFRQIRLLTYDYGTYNRYIIFVDCNGGKIHGKEMRRLIQCGFRMGKQEFVLGERSASMVRTGILSFVDKRIARELDKRTTMGIKPNKRVLSKYYSYRGLMLSSCHCIEDWYPKIVVVPDCFLTIPDQKIRYVYDKKIDFKDKNTGAQREWVQKDLADGRRDIEINAFDGCGVCHPDIMRQICEKIDSQDEITSAIIRAPFIKGVIHQMDYERFFAQRGVRTITDIWGIQHDVTPGAQPMMILTQGQYKGYSFFKDTGDIQDWYEYWKQFKANHHCLGVAKWNFSAQSEPLYTRVNYQVLQDLDLPYEKFEQLANSSKAWFEKIAGGDPLHTYCFLGMLANRHKPLNNYCAAILKNPEMLKEEGVRSYIIGLLEKYRDEFKCGKLWLKATFKFLAPDLIMLMEHIGGLEPKGCLDADEFYSFDRTGIMAGERLIERNPHISKSEHVVLKATNNQMLEDYCGHLTNVCIVNCKSITPQRLNGADFDGDLVIVIDEPTMMEGVDTNAAIVMDVEDKVTALAEIDNMQNKTNCIMRSLKSMIGEISNMSTAYHNKMPETEQNKKRYQDYIGLLSICNGKAIDYAKTGVSYPIPKNISKYGKPLPYFMKYASPYYKRLHKLSRAPSNMNRLCFDLERWEKKIRFKRTDRSFDWKIMYDEEIGYDDNVFAEIEKIYLDFIKTIRELAELDKKCRDYDRYQDELKEENITKEMAKSYGTDWQYYYNVYRSRCLAVCPDVRELANIAAVLCYDKHPTRNKKFLWRVAGRGVVENIKQVNILLPKEDMEGEFTYLGRKFTMAPMEQQQFKIHGTPAVAEGGDG